MGVFGKAVLFSLLLLFVVFVTGCGKSWTDVQVMCKESRSVVGCGEEQCLYLNSAGFSTDIRLVVTQQYYECKLQNCKGGQ